MERKKERVEDIGYMGRQRGGRHRWEREIESREERKKEGVEDGVHGKTKRGKTEMGKGDGEEEREEERGSRRWGTWEDKEEEGERKREK